MANQDFSEVLALAAEHGLALDGASISVNEMGLDFQVVLARTTTGEDWVLRIPRRAEVMERAAVEGRVLKIIAPRLSVTVPDWRIHTAQLIAYPLLPGEPGLELDATGTPIWRVDASSPSYSLTLGELLAELHSIEPADVATTGAKIHSPAEVRRAWRENIEKVSRGFIVAGHLLERWEAWLEQDSYWPEHSVFTHGEIYPGHTLIRDGRISGVLDWTTAAVGDPARDFAYHQTLATPEAFQSTVDRYVECGGRAWPRLAEHCAELASAFPLTYGVYVLDTGDETHREGAAAQLNPPPEK